MFTCVLNANAYVIDGRAKGTEWENAASVLLLDREESNNKTKFGTVNWAIEDGSLYLCFIFIEEKIPEDSSLTGVSVIVGDSDEFTVTVGSSPAESDSIKYHFEGVASVDYPNDGVCEIRVGAKYGLTSEIPVRVRFIDSNGSYSNVYDFVIENKSESYIPYEPDDYTEKPQNTTTKIAQTTNSVSAKTTKAEKTTKKSTSKTTRKNHNGLFDFIFDDKDETTIKSTKAEKTTKKSSAKTKKANVKYEKITETQNTEAINTFLNEETASESINNISPSNYPVSTTEGTRYKILTAIFGGIALVTVAALGTIGANRKANKKDNKDK